MRYKLRITIAAGLYRMRKAIVEPVFGQIKSVRGLRHFLLRGLANVHDEFRLIAFTHNLLNSHRHRAAQALSRDHGPSQLPERPPKPRLEARGREAVSGSAVQPLRHGELERSGRAPLERDPSRRRIGGAFADGKSPTDS
jgi:hypothetical protein